MKALTFDVFGTVVDWRSSIIREGAKLSQAKGLEIDWAKFADWWRAGYGPSMDRVRRGELPWTKLDALHRMILDDLLGRFRIAGLSEAEKDHLNRVWHRLEPWPDSIEGLARLRKRYITATLSNGNMSLLVELTKNAGLPFDCILSAELARHYKPDREAYLAAADLLGLEPGQILMVAAHNDDLRNAQAAGLRAAFISRPLENGPGHESKPAPGAAYDVVAKDLIDLAAQIA